jgi:hypothetical protein
MCTPLSRPFALSPPSVFPSFPPPRHHPARDGQPGETCPLVGGTGVFRGQRLKRWAGALTQEYLWEFLSVRLLTFDPLGTLGTLDVVVDFAALLSEPHRRAVPRSPSGRCCPAACWRPPALASRWRGHQREQEGMGWADAGSGKGRLIFLYIRFWRHRLYYSSC